MIVKPAALRRLTILLMVFSVVLGVSSCSKDASPAAPSTSSVATDMTVEDYLRSHGVSITALTAADLRGIRIGVSQPPNWFVDSSFQLPSTYAVIANTRAMADGFAPNATVLVHRLDGNFDPNEAIRRGPVDTTRLPGFVQQSASIGSVGSDPSSTVAGTYNDNRGRRLSVSSKYIIHSGASQRVIVQMLVTTTEKLAQSLNDDVQVLLNGLTVS